MAIYFGTTEITKLRDLAPQPGLDITDLWFGETNVYTVWQVYEGTLPATLYANGADMRQYQIYGDTLSVGEPTRNLFSSAWEQGNINSGTGQNEPSSTIIRTEGYIEVIPNKIYSLSRSIYDNYINVRFYSSDKSFIGVGSAMNIHLIYGSTESNPMTRGISFCCFEVINTNVKYMRINDQSNNLLTKYMMVEGEYTNKTMPRYEPYGYKLDISTSDGTSTTTTPIYIGNDPLEKVGNYSDYVDYELQKVVRVIKKYVLTGKEDWEEITGAYASRKYFRLVFAPINYCIRHVCVSSHLTQATITTSTTTVGFDVFDSTSVNGEVLVIRPTNVQSTTLEDFKAWLVEQYFAGTPVTIWCALTTAEETDPPVTLPALPTVEGTTIVDYAGSGTAPEKVLFKYRKEGF